jgi:hypothetical protein
MLCFLCSVLWNICFLCVLSVHTASDYRSGLKHFNKVYQVAAVVLYLHLSIQVVITKGLARLQSVRSTIYLIYLQMSHAYKILRNKT